MRVGVGGGGSWGNKGFPHAGLPTTSGPSRAASLDCPGGPPRPRGRAGVRRSRLRVPRPPARRSSSARPTRRTARSPRWRSRRGRYGACGRSRTPSRGSASGGSTSSRPRGRSTWGAAGCTTRRASRSSSTGRRPRPGRSTSRRRASRTASRSGAASGPTGGGCSISATSALDGSGSVAGGDFLLDELERSRSPHMRDIVATIQSDQYRLITRAPEPPLVVQGGPGTGKTAVGLHRASYLLYAYADRLRRVLVVGPNPTFMEYVSHVLPSLGEERVEQRAVTELVDGLDVTVADDGRDRAAEGRPAPRRALARRAVARRSRAAPEELVVRLEGEYVRRARARGRRSSSKPSRGELGLTAQARERFRMDVLRRFYEDYGARLGGLAWRDFGEIESLLRAKGFLTRWLDRVWPAARPETLVRTLLTQRVGARGGGGRDPRRLGAGAAPARRARGSAGARRDVALVDEAHALLDAPPRTFGHVIVDEAQDLTPMQLRARGAARDLRLADAARGHRPGHGPRRPPSLGGGPPRDAGRRRGGRRGAPARVPRAAGDHGPRAPAPRPDRARGGAARRVPPRRARRRASSASRRTTLVGAALRAPSSSSREDGLLAVILPAAARPARRSGVGVRGRRSRCSRRAAQGPRVRPRRGRRAGARSRRARAGCVSSTWRSRARRRPSS